MTVSLKQVGRPMYMSPMVKDPSIDEWIKKMGCVLKHTHTHWSVTQP